MELKREDIGKKMGKEKAKFSRFKALVDRYSKKAAVAVFSMTLLLTPACGNGTDTTDGGGDGSSQNGDTINNGDSDIGSPCDLYAEGHENKKTLNLGDAMMFVCDNVYGYVFKQKYDSGWVDLIGYELSNPGPQDWQSLEPGVPEVFGDVPVVGPTTVEVCSTSGGACEYRLMGTPLGDPNCTVTVAASRPICD